MTDAARDHPVLLFDGVCNLCNGVVRFVVEHDPEGVFRFAPLQSETARELLAAVGYERAGDGGADGESPALDTVVLVEGDDYYTKSDAALRVARRLERPWSLLWLFRAVPRSVRDRVYDLVATYRYLVFGKKDRCLVPTPELRERFLESDPVTDGGRE